VQKPMESPLAQSPATVTIMPPVLRGIVWAAVGFLALDLLTVSLDPFVGHPLFTEPGLVIGWFGGVIGWLLGVGAWEQILLPLMGRPAPWSEPKDWRRYWGLSLDHKVVGIQYLVSSTGGFLLAGATAMLMRGQLMSDRLTLFHTPDEYLSAVGVHGTIMMFSVATVAMIGGLGNYFVPLMIGAKSTVFPRLSALSHWLVPAGILTVLFSPLLGYWTTGWRGYEPLAMQDPSGIVYYYLGVFALTLSSLMVAANLTTTIVFRRAPGLTWNRLPMFVWGIMAVSLLNILWISEVQMTFILSLLDRLVPLNLFNADGSPLTYLSLFWLFGHPEVYIIVVPAFAMWNEILPVMAQKTLYARQWAVIGLVFVMMLSGLVWAHHMFTNMRNSEMYPFSFFTEMISIPTGFAFMAAFGTIWQSRLRLTAPTLLVLMSIFNFVIGGLTGVYLADVPVNLQVHDTFFVVAHFHYTIIGGMVFTWLASIYYWLPKLAGRMYNERLAKIGAVWIFISFNATFSQMFLLGLHGMNRWVPTYPPYLQPMNFEVSLWAFTLGAGFLFNLAHVVWAWRAGPKVTSDNPWHGRTLEWYAPSPPPRHNFDAPVRVVGSFYVYGEHVKPAVALGEATPTHDTGH
jgi:cytochrome c oxidase subunit 1